MPLGAKNGPTVENMFYLDSYKVELKGTATLKISMFYQKELNEP